MNHHARQCTARRKDGRPCRNWAIHGSDVALCVHHRKARHSEARCREARCREASLQTPQAPAGSLGFYEGARPLDEAAGPLVDTQARNLKDELGVTRLAIRYVLLRLQQEPDPAEFVRLVKLIFKGATTVAYIMRVQRSFPSDEAERRQQAIDGALDDLSAKWGIDL